MSTLQRTKRVDSMTNKLVLVRHGESEWNKKNIFTGIRNPDLTDKGVIEALWAGRVLKSEGLRFDVAFTSKLNSLCRMSFAREVAALEAIKAQRQDVPQQLFKPGYLVLLA